MPSTGQNLEPFTGYRDVCILSKNSRVGRKPPSNKQTNKQTNHPKTIHSYGNVTPLNGRYLLGAYAF